ncbi:MAG: glycosyltransferase family 2 protein [Planctomycetaceae bacterium]|nr:glycosyltransferase family 2 protein [Planctomycetaceae bacterium]
MQQLTVTIVIPLRNEAGNVEAIFQRTPEMGAGTELLFVEGGSTDGTYETVQRAIAAHPHRKTALYRQGGRGKGDAVRLGFDKATGDVLMILDADLTVPPEDLPQFYDALVQDRGGLINGARMVHPMEKGAMRLLNYLGNRFFAWRMSRIIGQRVQDTLCGTKVIRKVDYERLKAARPYPDDFDMFGDFDLIFGAARLGLKIFDLPIHYRRRTYGKTNIHRWQVAWRLTRMLRTLRKLWKENRSSFLDPRS